MAGQSATPLSREWFSTASTIENLELRLELDRGRAEIRDLEALLAVYKQHNERLRSILNRTVRLPGGDLMDGPPGVSVDVPVGPPTPRPSPVPHVYEHEPAPSAFWELLHTSQGREVGTWSSSHEARPQHYDVEERGLDKETPGTVGSDGWRGMRTSCDLCTGSKIRCDGGKPTCGNCESREVQCHYSAKRRPGPKPPRAPSDEVPQPPPRRPRTAISDTTEPHVTPNQLPPLLTDRFSTTHPAPHATHTRALSPVAAMLMSAAAAREDAWRVSFHGAQAMASLRPQPQQRFHTDHMAP